MKLKKATRKLGEAEDLLRSVIEKYEGASGETKHLLQGAAEAVVRARSKVIESGPVDEQYDEQYDDESKASANGKPAKKTASKKGGRQP